MFVRKSTDLRDWSNSEPIKVVSGGSPGKLWYQAECPHVVHHKGYFYLFRTSNYRGQPVTTVYRSQDPTQFGIDDDAKIVATLPIAAPEIIIQDGRYWIAALNPNLDGIRITSLEFVADPPSEATDKPQSAADADSHPRVQFHAITRDDLEDKIRGGMIAQIIGNLNGLPHEMKYIDEPGQVNGYVPALPEGARTDDDTDLEWLYIHEIQATQTPYITPQRIVSLWEAHVNEGIWCANLYARRLMSLGIEPPLTGSAVLNPWAEFNLSGQFLCESFALIAPGMPETASRLALHYTRVAVDGEPLQTTQLFSSMIATAFVTDDLHQIIQAGLAAVDPGSQIAEIVNTTVKICQAHPDDWRAARAEIKRNWQVYDGKTRDWNGYELNTACTVAALIYGEGDLVATLQTAFNLGWDCDNNAATAATIVGIIKGRKWIDSQNWQIRDVYKNTTRRGMPENETITSYEDRVIACAKLMLASNGCEVTNIDGKDVYQLPLETPVNVLNLGQGSESSATLRQRLSGNIQTDLAGNSLEQARAVYLATCLGLADDLKSRSSDAWQNAVESLQQHSIMTEVEQSPHPTGDRFKAAFQEILAK